MIKLILKKEGSNNYSGSDWNYELTTKYVLKVNNKLVEAGYFVHCNKLAEGKITVEKEVIELPSSQGCPVKCSFCASSLLQDINVLTSEEIYQVFEFVYKDNKITGETYLLVTMTGIGDYSICFNSINNAIKEINDHYGNVHFTVSSCIWTDESIDQVADLAQKVDLRAINITYISDKVEKIQRIIAFYNSFKYDSKRAITRFLKTDLKNIRINYIMIKGVNDGLDDFESFVLLCNSIKDRLIVRISKMNNTKASQNAGLLPVDISSMKEFQEYLDSKGFRSYLFYSCADDQMNCGQLLTEGL